jgi:hypothetical protein
VGPACRALRSVDYAIQHKSTGSATWRLARAAHGRRHSARVHPWLAAGHRKIMTVARSASMTLWLAAASLYSYYLDLSDYTRFYAGLSQLMVALIFFQMTAVIVILGAELNRGILELKKLNNGRNDQSLAHAAAG